MYHIKIPHCHIISLSLVCPPHLRPLPHRHGIFIRTVLGCLHLFFPLLIAPPLCLQSVSHRFQLFFKLSDELFLDPPSRGLLISLFNNSLHLFWSLHLLNFSRKLAIIFFSFTYSPFLTFLIIILRCSFSILINSLYFIYLCFERWRTFYA